MSTDAFAAAIAKGAALQRPSWREALRTGAIFGVIEAITPLVGWLIGSAAAKYASAWDHWIAFVPARRPRRAHDLGRPEAATRATSTSGPSAIRSGCSR